MKINTDNNLERTILTKTYEVKNSLFSPCGGSQMECLKTS